MNEADELFLGAIENMAYQNKLEVKLLFNYCDTNLLDGDEKEIIMASLDRMNDITDNIKSTVNKIRSSEWV